LKEFLANLRMALAWFFRSFELDLYRLGISVLGVLNQEYHLKSDDCRGGIDC
jgi:hypothetical protein